VNVNQICPSSTSSSSAQGINVNIFYFTSCSASFHYLISLSLLLSSRSFAVDQAKHGCKCNNNVCVRNEHSVHTRALTLLTEPHGKCSRTHVDQHDDINTCDISHARSRSQTLSPVRNYNTLTTGKEPKFEQIKRTTVQHNAITKPYKVSRIFSPLFPGVPLSIIINTDL
jgi:hypothetical protein